MDFSSNEGLASMAIEKIKILEADLELPARQHCQSNPFTMKMGQWAKLSSSSKTAPRILIFFNYHGCNYSFEMNDIEILEPAFFKHNNSSVATG
jgi:hypothetical protein